jgi:ketosteroid isomerase-like protein
MFRSGVLLVVVLLASGASAALAQTTADSASVTAFYGRWFGSAPKGFAAYASFYASDGYILPPGSPPVIGRAAIAEWFEHTRAQLSYTTQPQGIALDEIRFLAPDWVVYRTTLRGQRLPKGGGDPVPFETKYVDLLHRVRNDWEVAFRMWSDNR